ncbi:SRPBCC domain-containing protein [Clavibacter zhangzhiyongii]|uniref:SRPBCC domain-containing protein n=1 Tax=Clavibacter TaxID=1573 RepID=UPI0039E00FBC
MPLVAASPRPGVVWISWSFARSPDAVWSALTDPAAIARWLGDPVTCDIRPGGELVVDHGDGVRSRSDMSAAEPPHHLAMTWAFPDEPTSEVTFTIRAHDDGAVLELAHAVIADLADSYRVGWLTHLTYLEAVVDGDPLPASQFWKLHATLLRGFGD